MQKQKTILPEDYFQNHKKRKKNHGFAAVQVLYPLSHLSAVLASSKVALILVRLSLIS